MRRILKVGIAASIFVPVAAMAGDTVQLTPGRWEVTTTFLSVLLDGQPVPNNIFKNQIAFNCISPAFAVEPARYFLEPDSKKDCKPAGTVVDGRIAMAGACHMPFGEMMASGVGTYQPRSYEIIMKADAAMGGKPLVMNFALRGKYVGACKGDEDK